MATAAPTAAPTNKGWANLRSPPKGVSANPSGLPKYRIIADELERELRAELGDLSATDLLLLKRACELLAKRTRSAVDATRCLNSANRILRQLRAQYAQSKAAPDLQELLGAG